MTAASFHTRHLALAVGLGLGMALAACGASGDTAPSGAASASPATSAASSTRTAAGSPPQLGTAAPAEPSTRPSASIPAVAPTSVAAASVAAPNTSASASAVASPASTAGAVKLSIAPDSSQIDIRMRELLAGNEAKNEAVESSKAVSGAILLGPNATILPGSKVNLDLRTLKSDRSIRDNFIKGRFVLNTGQFPLVEFAPTAVQGLTWPLPQSGQKTFTLRGDATVRGVTRPLTWDVTAAFEGQTVRGEARTPFKLSDFEMQPPKAGPVVEVEDAGNLVLTFQAEQSPA